MSLYLDHAASTPLEEEVLKKLQESFKEDYANPSASHKRGRELKEKIDEVRKLILKECFLKEKEFSCIFVSSATEANNQILYSFNAIKKERDTVWLSKADHASLSVAAIEILGLSSVRFIPLKNNGDIHEEKFFEDLKESKLKGENPRLLALSLVNNHSGNDYSSFFEKHINTLRQEFPHLHIHADLSQAFLKVYKESSFDSLSISAHKVGGPKGIGALLMRKSSPLPLRALLRGGAQENSYRSSSLAAPLILALGERLQMKAYYEDKGLKEELSKNLKVFLPELMFPFETAETSPYILTFITPSVPSDMLLRYLEQKDIFVATSSACSSRVNGFSEVWDSFHILPQYHKHVLRLSFGRKTRQDELLDFALIFKDIYLGLKKCMVKK